MTTTAQHDPEAPSTVQNVHALPVMDRQPSIPAVALDALDDPTLLGPWLEGKIQTVFKDGTGALFVPYIARDGVVALMNAIYGPLGWSFSPSSLTAIEGDSGAWTANASIQVGDAVRHDVGSADGGDGRKGAVSDVLKRCARLFGAGQWITRLSNIRITVETRGDKSFPARGEVDRALGIWRGQFAALKADPLAVLPEIVWDGAPASAGGGGRSETDVGASTDAVWVERWNRVQAVSKATGLNFSPSMRDVGVEKIEQLGTPAAWTAASEAIATFVGEQGDDLAREAVERLFAIPLAGEKWGPKFDWLRDQRHGGDEDAAMAEVNEAGGKAKKGLDYPNVWEPIRDAAVEAECLRMLEQPGATPTGDGAAEESMATEAAEFEDIPF